MILRALLVTAAITAAFFVSAGECPLDIPAGLHSVRLTSYYGHQSPQGPPHLWQSEAVETIPGPCSVSADSEGHPIGHQWWIDGTLAETCGDLPLFSDGFESGSIERWTTARGEDND
ncbi:MAG: hypothetical protein DRJ65_00145 [Acidobacteria bacterium]|nr:MAG: hypothetical protein DRJ65_00145 [Acidobacteriota bacterium]